MSDYLSLEAGDELTGTEGEVVLFALAALERLSVDKALVVDDCDVSVSGGTVGYINGTGVAGTHLCDFGIDFLVGRGSNGALYGIALVILHGDLGLDRECSLDDHIALEGNYIKFGLTDRLFSGLVKCRLKSVGDKCVEGVIIEHALAVHFFDNCLGSLALTEAGDIHLSDVFSVSGIDSLVKRFLFDGELKLHLIAGGLIPAL